MEKIFKVLVVGTTPDYIEMINFVAADKVLFITDKALRASSCHGVPDCANEILCDIADTWSVLQGLRSHLLCFNQVLVGVTCFDCPSMFLTSIIAHEYHLAFTYPAAVLNCSDKQRSKELWRKAGVSTPHSLTVSSAEEAVMFCESMHTGCVIKPRRGSGSQLIYYCANGHEAAQNYQLVRNCLDTRTDESLAPEIIAEQYIDAPEYSVDVALSAGFLRIIRIARKIKDDSYGFGTTLAYELLNQPPDGLTESKLLTAIYVTLKALDVSEAICMLDFFVIDGNIVMLEASPHPGGECLPYIIEYATGQNILLKALDFAVDGKTHFGNWQDAQPHIGVRIIARHPGLLQAVNINNLPADPSVREIVRYQQSSPRIVLPPADYDSRVIGHVVAHTLGGQAVYDQISYILSNVEVVISG